MEKRIALKQYRIGRDMTQDEMAEKIGVDRATYSAIENGNRDGGRAFWMKLQAAFPELEDAAMWRFYTNAQGI